MKANKPSESSPNSASRKLNIIEVEFRYLDTAQANSRRKITIPHKQFSPPSVLWDNRTEQWFLWCAGLGIYQEVKGSILQLIEVS